MAAHRIAALGAAGVMTPDANPLLPQLLRQALADPALTRAAQAFARRHQGYDQSRTIELAADRCEAVQKRRA